MAASKQVEMIDILRGILGNTAKIEASVSGSYSGASSGDKSTLKTLMSSDVSARSQKLNDMKAKADTLNATLGIFRQLKEIDVSSVLKFYALPFGSIANTIKNFYDQLYSVSDSKTVKAAGALMRTTVDMINMLMTINGAKLRMKLRLFPTSAVTRFIKNFFIGKGTVEKPGGLLGALIDVHRVMSKNFNAAQSKSMNAGMMNIKSIMMSCLNVMKTTMMIGLLAVPALVLVPLGIGAILYTLLWIKLLANAINKMKTIITKPNVDAIQKIGMYVLVAAGVVFLSAAVGLLIVQKDMVKNVAIGMLAILATTVAIAGLSLLISKIATKEIKTGFRSILMCCLFLVAGATMVLMAYGLSKILNKDTIGGVFMALGAIVVTTLLIGGVSFLLSRIGKTLWKGVIGFVPILLICALAGVMTVGVMELGKKINWKDLGNGLGAMGTVVAAVAAVAAVCAVAVTYAWIGFAGFIPLALIAVGTILMADKVIELTAKLEKAGGSEKLEKAVVSMGSIFTGLVEAIGSVSIIKVGKAMLALPAILGIMASVTMLADVISKFETDDDGKTIKAIHFDKDGNVTAEKTVDIAAIGNALGKAMSLFSTTVLDALSKAANPKDGKKKVKLITMLMEPVSKFADVISKFSTGKDGVIKTVEMDENGKVISEREVNIAQVANSIATGVSNFINTIGPAIEQINNMPSISSANVFKDDPAQKLEDALNEIVKFNTTVSSIEVNQGKADQFQKMNLTFAKTMNDTFSMYGDNFLKAPSQKNLATFVKKHVDYINNMTKALKKNKTPFREYVDTLKEFTAEMDKVKKFFDEDKSLILTVDKSNKAETHNHYDMTEKDFDKLGESLQAPITAAIQAGCDGMTISSDIKYKMSGGKETDRIESVSMTVDATPD